MTAGPEPPTGGTAVEVVAFTAGCRVPGRVLVGAGRLSDLLNAEDVVRLANAVVVRHGAPTGALVSDLEIPRTELLAVSTAASEGDPLLRTQTRRHPMMVRVGPYLIHGHLHSPPGADPLVAMDSRGPMVPLTEATLECEWAGVRWVERMAAVIVNRDQIDVIEPVPEEEVLPPIVISATAAARLDQGPRRGIVN